MILNSKKKKERRSCTYGSVNKLVQVKKDYGVEGAKPIFSVGFSGCENVCTMKDCLRGFVKKEKII